MDNDRTELQPLPAELQITQEVIDPFEQQVVGNFFKKLDDSRVSVTTSRREEMLRLLREEIPLQYVPTSVFRALLQNTLELPISDETPLDSHEFVKERLKALFTEIHTQGKDNIRMKMGKISLDVKIEDLLSELERPSQIIQLLFLCR